MFKIKYNEVIGNDVRERKSTEVSQTERERKYFVFQTNFDIGNKLDIVQRRSKFNEKETEASM